MFHKPHINSRSLSGARPRQHAAEGPLGDMALAPVSLAQALVRRPQSSASLDRHVGARLRVAREAQALAIWQLAQIVGSSLETLIDYEAGRRRMPPARLVDFSRVLAVDARFFFEGYHP